MICAPAFNHKLKKFYIFRGFLISFSQRNLTIGRKNEESDNEKATSWNIAAKELPTVEQIQNGRRADEITQLRLDVARHCFVLVFPLQKFRYFLLRNKAHSTLLLLYFKCYWSFKQGHDFGLKVIQ